MDRLTMEQEVFLPEMSKAERKDRALPAGI